MRCPQSASLTRILSDGKLIPKTDGFRGGAPATYCEGLTARSSKEFQIKSGWSKYTRCGALDTARC